MDLQRYSLAELFGMYFNLELFDVLVGQEIDEVSTVDLNTTKHNYIFIS